MTGSAGSESGGERGEEGAEGSRREEGAEGSRLRNEHRQSGTPATGRAPGAACGGAGAGPGSDASAGADAGPVARSGAGSAPASGSEAAAQSDGAPVTPDERGSTGPGRLPTPRQALVFLVGIALLFISGGVFLLLLGFGEAGIFLAQWLFLFLPAVVFVRLGGFDVRETLSLRMPGRRQLAGAVLVMAGGTPIAWFLAWLQSFIIPVPVEFAEEMARLLVTDDPFRLLWLLVLIALTPAICEEFVFRGVVLGGMRGRFSPARLIVLNGIIFGIFHLSFQTVFRFLPTAWLGVVIAGVVWKTRSIWTGVLMHFLNNGVIVLLVASPLLRVRFEHLSEAPPLLILPVAILLLATGVRILQEHQPEGTTS